MGWEGACASILGAAGEEFGLLLVRSLEDFVAFTRLAGEPGRPAKRRRGIGIPLLSVNFDHPDSITGGHVLAKRARAHGWQPGPEGRLAYLLKVSPDSVAQPVTTDNYRLATASLEAVRLFVEKNRRLFDEPPTERVETRLRIAMPTGDLEVRVTAPPRLRCQGCGESRLVAFSCKGRGSCPSCMGRRMSATAANLIERVLAPQSGLLYCVGRDGNTNDIGLGTLGIKPGKYGLLEVNESSCSSARR